MQCLCLLFEVMIMMNGTLRWLPEQRVTIAWKSSRLRPVAVKMDLSLKPVWASVQSRCRSYGRPGHCSFHSAVYHMWPKAPSWMVVTGGGQRSSPGQVVNTLLARNERLSNTCRNSM